MTAGPLHVPGAGRHPSPTQHHRKDTAVARKKAPTRMGSVWTQMPFMHGPDGGARLTELTAILADAQQHAVDRLHLVARHDGAAAKAAAIVRCHTGWNGYVPPARNPEGEHPPVNESPARVEIERLLAHLRATEARR